jgi:hypothetical protein
MWSFRDYLKKKCADPEFFDQYREQCCICPLTVLIISTIRERGLSNEAVARGAGVEFEHLRLLESADRCSFDDVQKLFRFLGLPMSGGCGKSHE